MVEHILSVHVDQIRNNVFAQLHCVASFATYVPMLHCISKSSVALVSTVSYRSSGLLSSDGIALFLYEVRIGYGDGWPAMLLYWINLI
jgi:hypothetical protein